MRKVIVFLSFVMLTINIKAQRHEIGVFAGIPNLISDIGDASYLQWVPDSVNPEFAPYSLGLLYRFNFNPRMGVRLNLGYNHVEFNDAKTREDYRTERGLYGDNDIIEASLLFEYAFFDINDEVPFAHSPFIFAGVGAFMAKDRKYNIVHSLNEDGNGNPIIPTTDTDFNTKLYYDEYFKTNFSLPFGIGYKVKMNYNWMVTAEVGVRFTGTERLDYSFANETDYTISIEDAELNQANFYPEMLDREAYFINKRQTGNIKSTDWYVVSGISIAYTFGRPPCFCK